MTALWFLVILGMNPDGSHFMKNMPVVTGGYEHCMQQGAYLADNQLIVCVEADDFADLINTLLNNFDFGGQKT